MIFLNRELEKTALELNVWLFIDENRNIVIVQSDRSVETVRVGIPERFYIEHTTEEICQKIREGVVVARKYGCPPHI